MTRGPRVAIIGGGPAGATCARMLASAGANVSLFEARPSSEKPCGGGIPAQALAEFPELADASLPRRVVRDVLILSPSNHEAWVQMPVGIHVFQRLELDSFLRRRAEAAGATIHLTRVRRVRQTGGGQWELLNDEGPVGPFEQLVGADGVRGSVRRSLAGPFRDEHLTLALYAYISGVTRSEMVLKFFGDFDGYLWAFPRTDHVSVGICAARSSMQVSRLEEELHRFVDLHYQEGKIAKGSLKGYFIPSCLDSPAIGPASGESDPENCYRWDSNWALIGDAAGFVDPITREGIAYAMRSAAALARHLLRDGRFPRPALPENLRWAHRYRGEFYRREFLENLTRLAAASSSIRRVLADLFEGRQGYQGLKSRLLRNALPCGIEVGLGRLAALRRRRDGGRPAVS